MPFKGKIEGTANFGFGVEWGGEIKFARPVKGEKVREKKKTAVRQRLKRQKMGIAVERGRQKNKGYATRIFRGKDSGAGKKKGKCSLGEKCCGQEG